jgi:hypothetical protein
VWYLFQHPMPVAWLLADILTILVTLLVGIFIVRKSRHPLVAMLECFGFVFLYVPGYLRLVPWLWSYALVGSLTSWGRGCCQDRKLKRSILPRI